MQRRGRANRRPQQREAEHRINQQIRATEVRVVGEDVESAVYPIKEALKMAEDRGVDLVEISPDVKPPICRLVDYNKFLYEKKRREKERKAKAKQTEVKEIRFTPNTDDHDFEFKAKHAEKFLSDGHKVKCFVQFRGRSILFQDRGQLLLLKFAERLAEFGALESMPKMEGRRMFAMLTPKKKK